MDPNETLKRIRELATAIESGSHCDDCEELALLVGNLDHWLKIGGFKPTDWTGK